MTLITTATELPRLMVCIGSRLMPAMLPADSNREARDEGNAAHWLAEQLFKGVPVASGAVAFNGYIITDEMIEHVRGYASALNCGELECDTSYSGENWEVRGRADHLVYEPAGVAPPLSVIQPYSTLTIDDFKYGWRLVSPERNFTLLSHAIGWCQRPGNPTPDHIVLRIHQPRPYHPDGPLREWSCSYSDLIGYYKQIQARLAYPDATLTTSLEQCAKCHALAGCPAARTAGMNAIDASMLAFSDNLPKDVLTHELETLRQASVMIENRRDALEELISHRISSGDVFNGYVLERRYGHARFKPGLTGKMLSIAAGVDLTKDGTVTPAEAKRRGVNEAAIAALTERPLLPSKLKAVDVDSRARRIFGDGR